MILMSNNQWKCDRNNDFWRERGEDCSAEARVPGMARAYLEVMPDILGLQEVSNRQAEILMDNMRHVKLDDGTEASYEYLSGRDTPIVYRRDKLKLLESGRKFRNPEHAKAFLIRSTVNRCLIIWGSVFCNNNQLMTND